MPGAGWISKWAFEDNALAADTDGRAAMEDGYITGAKIADATIDIGKLSTTLLGLLLPVGRIDYSSVDYSKIG